VTDGTFPGFRTAGPLPILLPKLKSWTREHPRHPPLPRVHFDLRGRLEEVLARVLPPAAPTGPGRPKLGVVAREVSLLPRHWEWLEEQPNGASAALRRLVDEARKTEPEQQRRRRAQDALSRILTALAGDLPNYEEATRALYAADRARFDTLIAKWPADIRRYLATLAAPAF
jgi:uncharacterized protein